MARATPTVKENKLYYIDEGVYNELLVGSPDWYAWLNTATSFAFHCTQGSFTARRERASNKRGNCYWKAYAKRGGKLFHAYLGKAETLTSAYMYTVAAELARTSGMTSVDQASPSLPTQPKDLIAPIATSFFEQEDNGLLQVQLTEIVGREEETREACVLLQRLDVRLLTITGPGGVGKTRLALHVANVLAATFSDGIRCISLAPVTDAALVVPTIAQELGFVKVGDEPLLSRLISFLHDKQMLLLLDNFEQIIAAAPILVEILSVCPLLKMLVTSREVLHIRIEHEFVVPPLALPDVQHLSTVEQLSQYAATRLFIQRALAMKADFQVTTANVQTIAEICTRLDGLPLAIELAAARVKLFTPTALLNRLQHRLLVLTNGARDLPRRQQTLRDTLAWSYDLLNTEEQWLIRHLSVFVGGCTLDAAEEFCHRLHDDSLQILECITSLIDKSLLQRKEQGNGDIRLMMLETVREYNMECLSVQNEDICARNTHAMYYLALAQKSKTAFRTAQQEEWFNRLDQEYDNLRAALHWLLEQDKIEDYLSMCSALWPFWLIRDRQGEGYQWIERALMKREQKDISPEMRAHIAYAAGVLTDSQGQYQHAIELWNECLALYEQINIQSGIVATLNRLGHAYARNAPAKAHSLYEKSLALAQQWHDQSGIADALTSLADEASGQDDYSKARSLFHESLTLFTLLGDKRSQAHCLAGLGHVAASDSDHVSAYTLLKESLALYREVGDRVGIALGLVPLGMVTLYLGDYSTARILLEESLTVSKELGNQGEIASYLGKLGEIALYQKGENEPARTLLEESLAIFRETGNEEEIGAKLFALGSLEHAQGNYLAARKWLEECVIIFRKRGNRAMMAAALHLLGHLESHTGNYVRARTFMAESVAITRQIGDRLVMPSRLSYLGLMALNEGDFAEARTLLKESVAISRESGDLRGIADSLGVMGLLPLNEGDYALARELLEESLEISKFREDRHSMSYRLADLGLLAIRQGNMQEALPLIEEALALSIRLGNRWFIASCLERLGEIAAGQCQYARAAQLWGAASALREAINAPIPPIECDAYEHAILITRAKLSEEEFLSAWQSGYMKTPEQVVAIQANDQTADTILAKKMHMHGQATTTVVALAEKAPKRTDPAQIQASVSEESAPFLTNRELDVLKLLMLGASNREIAFRLVISEGTVKKHVSNICGKFNVQRRSQVITRALTLSSL